MGNAEQFTEGKEGQREGRLRHQHKEHSLGRFLLSCRSPSHAARCPHCRWDSLSAAKGQGAEEESWWRAQSRGSAAAALGMWADLLLLLVVLMVLGPAGWALTGPLLCTLTQPPALSDSSDMKKAKYM